MDDTLWCLNSGCSDLGKWEGGISYRGEGKGRFGCSDINEVFGFVDDMYWASRVEVYL